MADQKSEAITAVVEDHPERKSPGTDHLLKILLMSMLLVLISATAYTIIMPIKGDGFTEFYILGPDGKANDYPADLLAGEQKSVILGIVNHEHGNVTYDMVVLFNDSVHETTLQSLSATLSDGQKWEKAIDLRADTTGSDMKIAFLLYMDGNKTAPYRECYLWVNVTNAI